ncbi:MULTISPECIES: SH3 domain-containing protein [Nostocales]|uniref:SH3 domain-containing protein n=1 Tax=Nostocales TaxID=1161 RepID=UPI001F42C50F|nr:SH3 domain-containing protein [Nostoc sp. CMAA1605]MCF4970183.1 hypothetical protein [Nostoc sp. CMAA1605]
MSKIFISLMIGTVFATSALPATAAPINLNGHNSNTYSSPQTGKRLLLSNTVRVCTRDRGGLLNMRSGPGTGYSVVYRVPNGAVVSVINSTDYPYGGQYWYQVSFRNVVGWVRGDFVC